MALIATMGAKKDAGIPAEEQFVSMLNAQGTWTPYISSYTVGTSASIVGYGIAAGFVNVKGHTAITLPDLSSYNFKTLGAYKADGTCEVINNTSFDCTDYDYVSIVAGGTGSNITLNFTVTA